MRSTLRRVRRYFTSDFHIFQPASRGEKGFVRTVWNNTILCDLMYSRSYLDIFLADLMSSLPSAKHTILNITTPITSEQLAHHQMYEMDNSMQPLHVELKRDISLEERDDSGNITLVDGPLFERYSYFNPGEFLQTTLTSLSH